MSFTIKTKNSTENIQQFLSYEIIVSNNPKIINLIFEKFHYSVIIQRIFSLKLNLQHCVLSKLQKWIKNPFLPNSSSKLRKKRKLTEYYYYFFNDADSFILKVNMQIIRYLDIVEIRQKIFLNSFVIGRGVNIEGDWPSRCIIQGVLINFTMSARETMKLNTRRFLFVGDSRVNGNIAWAASQGRLHASLNCMSLILFNLLQAISRFFSL